VVRPSEGRLLSLRLIAPRRDPAPEVIACVVDPVRLFAGLCARTLTASESETAAQSASSRRFRESSLRAKVAVRFGPAM
jgi:hypothetical protein